MKKRFRCEKISPSLLCLVFASSLFFYYGCGRQETVPAPALGVASAPVAPPRLEVEGGNERDLGTISEHDVVPLEFVLRNAGESALTIIDVTFSCPCGEFLNLPNNLELQPNETFLLKMNLFAQKISLGNFIRYLILDLGNERYVSVSISGHIKANFEISPGQVIDLGALRDGGATWEKEVRIRGVNQLAENFRLAPDPKSAFFVLQLDENALGDYTLKVSPKNSLPYTQRFRSDILLPIAEPSGLPDLRLRVRAQIGEKIAFKPGNFSFQEADFAESETLSRTASFGIVPQSEATLQEKKNIEPAEPDRRSRLTRLFFQTSSTPRKITSLDWEPLFVNLEFDCPAGVCVEKELHEEGISLQIHVDRNAFAEKRQISIVPRRDQNKFQKINLTLRREDSDNTAEQPKADDDAEDENAEEEE